MLVVHYSNYVPKIMKIERYFFFSFRCKVLKIEHNVRRILLKLCTKYFENRTTRIYFIAILILFRRLFYPVNRFSARRSAPIFMNDSFYFKKFHREGTLKRSFFDILNSF